MADRDEFSAPFDPSVDWGRWSSVAVGRVSSEWMDAIRSDPLLRRARVVGALVFGGERRALASTEIIRSTSRDGRRVEASPDLEDEPELEESIDIGNPGPRSRSISATVPGRLVRAGDMLAAGRQLEAHGEVSLLIDGMTWEHRLVFLRGPTVGGMIVGRDDEPVELTISDPQIHTRLIPPWLLDTTRFDELPASASGKRIPLIVGYARGVPCPRVASSVGGGDDDFLVGYGSLSVSAQWIQGATTASGTVVVTEDDRGLPVTLLRYTAGASDDFATINATAKETGSAIARSVVRSIERILTLHGLIDSTRISDRLFSEARVREPDTGLGTGARTSPRICVNEPTRALDYVTDDLLGDYPWCSMVWDGAGLGPVVIDHRAEPVARLEVGQYPIAERVEGGGYELGGADDLVTSVIVRYDYDPVTDTYEGVETRDQETSTICATASRISGGDNPSEDLDGLTIGDQPTAAFTADWIVEHRSRPYLDVMVLAYPVAWIMLRLGDPVRWTDDDEEIVLDDEEAILIGRAWRGGMVELTVRVFPRAWGDIGGGSRAYPSRY